ncbi:hypothetical protein JXA88_18615, partial [Candidatus Fermentibacteria bacterium]|nr:hypothetical protein [Candidatus Fermentibacteria bacterium]
MTQRPSSSRPAMARLCPSLSLLFLLTMACFPSQDPARAFQTLCAEQWRSVEHATHQVVEGREGWLFFGPELRHISLGPFWGLDAARHSASTDADPIAAILDFRTQLDRLGVNLLMVPVPPKAMVYPDMLAGEPLDSRRLDPFHREFYDLLRREGVAVLDLSPVFRDARQDTGEHLYCKTDTHWSGHGCVVAAEVIAQELRDRTWAPQATEEMTYEWRDIDIVGDLSATLGCTGSTEPLRVRSVGRRMGGGLIPVPPDRKSPILLLGDSHCLVFHAGDDMHAGGAGLLDQLALELGSPVDLVGVRGSGATPARINLMRRARSSPGYLSAKRVIIWCFAAREFTESTGWQKIP